MAVGVIGFLCFISTFFTAASHFGDFTNFEQRARSESRRALVGMVMILAGAILTTIGQRGLAGSGLKLDPEAARRDVEPWARMTGGLVKDAIDEADLKLSGPAAADKLPFDERLRRLDRLRQDGLISESEFAATKKRILESA